MNYDYEDGITLCDLIKILIEKWWIIVLSFLVCTTIAIIYSYHYCEDYYVASSSMIVQVNNPDGSDYANLLVGENLVDTYSEIVTSHLAIMMLKENLNLPYSDSTIENMISVKAITNTLIIELDVKSTNPVLATNIANELVVIVQNLSDSYEGLENIDILDIAYVPESPAGPNRVLNVIIGAILGIIIGSGLIFVIEAFDRNIKTEKDVEQNLKLRVLGIIPDYLTEEGDLK